MKRDVTRKIEKTVNKEHRSLTLPKNNLIFAQIPNPTNTTQSKNTISQIFSYPYGVTRQSVLPQNTPANIAVGDNPVIRDGIGIRSIPCRLGGGNTIPLTNYHLDSSPVFPPSSSKRVDLNNLFIGLLYKSPESNEFNFTTKVWMIEIDFRGFGLNRILFAQDSGTSLTLTTTKAQITNSNMLALNTKSIGKFHQSSIKLNNESQQSIFSSKNTYNSLPLDFPFQLRQLTMNELVAYSSTSFNQQLQLKKFSFNQRIKFRG